MSHLNAQWNLISRINRRRSWRCCHRRAGAHSCKLPYPVLWPQWDQQVRHNKARSAKTLIPRVISKISLRITIRVVPIRQRQPTAQALWTATISVKILTLRASWRTRSPPLSSWSKTSNRRRRIRLRRQMELTRLLESEGLARARASRCYSSNSSNSNNFTTFNSQSSSSDSRKDKWIAFCEISFRRAPRSSTGSIQM